MEPTDFPPPHTHAHTHLKWPYVVWHSYMYGWNRKKEKYNHMRFARTRKEQVQATFV